MTSLPFPTARRTAFTIIELLTVITIILILAGLVLGIAGHAQGKAARSRADAEIHAFSTATDNYQIDNGTYPRDPGTNGTSVTDTLDATMSYDPAASGAPTYKSASLVLYRLLSGTYYIATSGSTSTITLWTQGSGVAKPTAYFTFKDSQLMNSVNVTSGYIDPITVQAIMDPFGFSYGYSTANLANLETINAGGTGKTPPPGYNPTYDLWSTAGYSTSSGKPYPSSGANTIAPANYNTLWVKNW